MLTDSIREVICPLNLVFPPAAIYPVDVDFSFQKLKGGECVRAGATPFSIGRRMDRMTR